MEEITQTLINLGLTEVQAKILLALSKFDYAAAKDLAKFTGIHRQEIYPVLTGLNKIGLVERKIGIPNKYKIMPLNEVLNVLLERKNNWMAELQKTASELIEKVKIETVPKSSNGEDYDFKLITGIERFSQALKGWHENAQTIDVFFKFDRFGCKIRDRLKADPFEQRKDIKIRLVTCAPPGSVPHNKETTEICYVPFDIPVDIAIYNGNRAHIATYSNREGLQTDVGALTSNHPCFVQMLQNYFDVLWLSGRELGITKKRPKQDLSYKPEEKELEQLH